MRPAEIRRNQIVFREVNQRIADITGRHHEPTSGFLCECGRDDCLTVIQLALTDYREIRGDEALFITAPAHRVDGVDRLVETRTGFEIVAQHG